MTFKDREILPIGGTKFGIILKQKEAEALAGHGFNVKSKTLAPGEDPSHYLVVWVSPAKLNDGFSLSRLEMDGRADVVIHPEPWKAGGRTGVKAYVVATWAKSESLAARIRKEIAGERAVMAGWAFGVPEDGRDQWLDLVTAAVMRAYS